MTCDLCVCAIVCALVVSIERMSQAFEDVKVLPHAVSDDTAREALARVRKLPDKAWAAVNARSKDRSRIKFSAHHFYGESDAWARQVPPELLRLGEEAVEAARLKMPTAPWNDFQIDTLVLNRYPKNKGVGFHTDPPKWVPLVVGVTLYDDPYGPLSSMQFRVGGQKEVNLTTPHRSAYVFHSRAYTNLNHSRKPGATRQKGFVYSFTFRSKAAAV